MIAKHKFRGSAHFRFALLALVLLLFAASFVMAQEDSEGVAYQQSPVMRGMEVARELIEDDIGYQMRLRRWRYFEDRWNTEASGRLYGAWGIDNCVASIPILQKRGDVIYGWTFIFTETSGEERQARVTFDLQHSVVCDEAIVPPQFAPPPQPTAVPQAPETEADPQAVAPAAPSAANLGAFVLGGHIASLDTAAINAMKSAGMTWIKKQVRHGISDGGDVIAQAKANGFKVLLGALGNKSQLASNFDGYVNVFAEYVAHLASLGADAIEVWNEPNIDREWPNGRVGGADYTRLLAAAYNAIKAANPATIVISGAPAPTGFYGAAGCAAEGCNDDHFMQQMAQAGAASYLDCVGVHYNAGTSPPNSTTGANVSGWHYSWYLPSMMDVYRGAFPSKPLCFTELGYLSGEGLGSLPGGFAWAANTSLSQHADWLGGAVSVARASGYVNMIIVWNVNFTNFGADPMAGYAIIRPGGGCPACNSLRSALG
ncbi:MAG: hypothetical protein F4X02_09115 [Chloroflexi bacterium]|nr:hypothetical protein [Chloroflexota bacterium]